MSSTGSTSANASDVGLIVQGTLIFLSAIAAIVGYYVQGRLKSKERQREVHIKRKEELHRSKLNIVRDKITRFVGPAHFLALTLNMNMFGLRTKLGEFYPDIGLETQKQIEETNMGFSQLMKGEWNQVTADSFFGKTMMAKLKENPNSPASKHFRRIIKVSLRTLITPLSDLIKDFAGFLQEWASLDEFQKIYPCAGPLKRNEFPIQLMQFEMEIVEVVKDWENNTNLDVFWTEQFQYPFLLAMYLIIMMTKLREMENKEGMASHALSDDNSIRKNAIEHIDGKKKSRYVSAQKNG